MDWKSPTKSKDNASEAAQLVDTCCRRLAQIGHKDSSVADLAIVLASVERILHAHLLSLLEEASVQSLFPEYQFSDGVLASFHDSSLIALAARLQVVQSHFAMNNCERTEHDSKFDDIEACSNSRISYARQCINPKVSSWRSSLKKSIGQTKEGGINSLLFHLVFVLQICLVRIEEADAVLSRSNQVAKKRSELLADELCRKDFVLTQGVFQGSHIHTALAALERDQISLPVSTFPFFSERTMKKGITTSSERNIVVHSKRQTTISGRALVCGAVGGLGWIALMRYFSNDRHMNDADIASSRRSAARIATKIAGLSIAALLTKRKLLFAQIRSNLLGSASTLSIWQHKWIIAQVRYTRLLNRYYMFMYSDTFLMAAALTNFSNIFVFHRFIVSSSAQQNSESSIL